MYKILVTTKFHSMNGCSIHTLVIEYDSIENAHKAAKIINNQSSSAQSALCLF